MNDKKVFDVVLLLALPASGKSEVRNLLANVEPETLVREFHIGENVQLDDYPYVYFMRCIDDELEKMGEARLFSETPDKSFYDLRAYGALIRMLNEDYEDLFTKKQIVTDNVSKYYLERFDKAAKEAGMDCAVDRLDPAVMDKLCEALKPLCEKMLQDKYDNYPDTMEGKTTVIEMARGGNAKHSLPLADPEGYQYSLRQFSDHILTSAAILYIWVTPEESRRKNHERAKPNGDGTSLFHETPLEVMYNEYGICDMIYLRDHSEVPDTVTVKTNGTTYHVPIGVFDNREDQTTPFRAEPSQWNRQLVNRVTVSIKAATDTMWAGYKKD